MVLWLAFGLLAVICGAMLVYVLRASWLKGDPFQPAVGFLLVAFLGYGIGALHARYGTVATTRGPLDPLPGLALGLIATLMFSIGYLAPIGRGVEGKVLDRLWPSFNPRRAFVAGLICFGIGATASVYYFVNGEYFAYTTSQSLELQFSTIGYFREFLYIGLTLIAVTAYGPDGTSWMRRATLFLGALSIMTLLPTGIRYYVLVVATCILIPRHYYYRRLRLLSVLLAMGLIVGIVYPIGEMYRRQYQVQFGPPSIASAATGLFDQLSQLGPGQYLDFAFGPALGRIDLATPASALQLVVPSVIPYKFGATFIPAVIFWVPRLVWPDKPTFQYDNLLGRVEGFIAPTDYRTSVKYSYVGELYLDFGWPGVVLGMAFYGLMFRIYYQITTRRKHPIGIWIYSMSLVIIWTIETPLGPSLGGQFRDVVSGLLVLWVCGTFKRGIVPIADRSMLVRGALG